MSNKDSEEAKTKTCFIKLPFLFSSSSSSGLLSLKRLVNCVCHGGICLVIPTLLARKYPESDLRRIIMCLVYEQRHWRHLYDLVTEGGATQSYSYNVAPAAVGLASAALYQLSAPAEKGVAEIPSLSLPQDLPLCPRLHYLLCTPSLPELHVIAMPTLYPPLHSLQPRSIFSFLSFHR